MPIVLHRVAIPTTTAEDPTPHELDKAMDFYPEYLRWVSIEDAHTIQGYMIACAKLIYPDRKMQDEAMRNWIHYVGFQEMSRIFEQGKKAYAELAERFEKDIEHLTKRV